MNSLLNFFKKDTSSKNITRRILSFDGGGVRAIAGIVFLKKFELETGYKVCDSFDMFVGTSAGAFNAACFAHEHMSASDVKKFWNSEYLDRTMQTSFFWDKASLVQARPRYESEGRIKLFNEIFGDKKIGESTKPLLTISYDIEKREHVFHNTFSTPEVSFVDAICASSAAPMYFPTYQMDSGSWMIDGGIVTNNPTLVGYAQAKKVFPNDNIKVLSIGSGLNKHKISGSASSRWGGVGWLRNDIMGMMLDSEVHDDIAQDLIGESYLRINSPLGRINKMLDDDSDENLEKIHLMGMEWWSKFGETTKKFIED